MEGFSPVIVRESPVISTPNRNLTGNPRIARDIAADVYNTVQKWNDYHVRGATIVKNIAGILANDPQNRSETLESSTLTLYDIVGECSNICDSLLLYRDRMEALNKLHKEEHSLFISLPIERMVAIINNIHKAYCQELTNKRSVLENIVDSGSDSNAMFFAALWTYQLYITSDVTLDMEALLTETGHRKIK